MIINKNFEYIQKLSNIENNILNLYIKGYNIEDIAIDTGLKPFEIKRIIFNLKNKEESKGVFEYDK